MIDNTISMRLAQAYDTEENWSKTTFTPARGEIIFFAPDDTHGNLRMKVGDGNTPLERLPFIALAATTE